MTCRGYVAVEAIILDTAPMARYPRLSCNFSIVPFLSCPASSFLDRAARVYVPKCSFRNSYETNCTPPCDTSMRAGTAPLYKARGPSSRTMVRAASAMLLYGGFTSAPPLAPRMQSLFRSNVRFIWSCILVLMSHTGFVTRTMAAPAAHAAEKFSIGPSEQCSFAPPQSSSSPSPFRRSISSSTCMSFDKSWGRVPAASFDGPRLILRLSLSSLLLSIHSLLMPSYRKKYPPQLAALPTKAGVNPWYNPPTPSYLITPPMVRRNVLRRPGVDFDRIGSSFT
mmetsp:Transcript_42844/g.130300  ORF Transcript_42844/g.130300 Transcript_42844/m.130300 type:complete len:281 (-) Transcript_42844:293-1135(-)